MDAIIFDVDGTLANVESIRHHVLNKPKNFDAFHNESVDCPPHHWVVRAAQDYADMGIAPLVVTARRTRWFYHTLLWLHENGVPHHDIFMRGDLDNRPDYEVKSDILREIRGRGYNVLAAYDDNPSVVQLWTEHGIPTVVVPGWVVAA